MARAEVGPQAIVGPGADLDAPADPGRSDYPARPEWYFLSLFQMLKLFPGKQEVIITREFLVTGLRSMAAAKGKVIPAGIWGKQKTFITMVAMGALLLAKGLGAHLLSLFPPMLTFNSQTLVFSEVLLLVADLLVLLATIWTIFSGIEYMIEELPLFQSGEATGKTQ